MPAAATNEEFEEARSRRALVAYRRAAASAGGGALAAAAALLMVATTLRGAAATGPFEAAAALGLFLLSLLACVVLSCLTGLIALLVLHKATREAGRGGAELRVGALA